MSLERVIGAAFKHHGRDALAPTEIVGAIALDRGWFTPEEVRTLIERGIENDLLERENGTLRPTFDIGAIAIPPGYAPDPDVLARVPVFERILERLDAGDRDRRASVAAINELQAELGIPSDVAAVVFAHGCGIDVATEARRARRALEG